MHDMRASTALALLEKLEEAKDVTHGASGGLDLNDEPDAIAELDASVCRSGMACNATMVMGWIKVNSESNREEDKSRFEERAACCFRPKWSNDYAWSSCSYRRCIP